MSDYQCCGTKCGFWMLPLLGLGFVLLMVDCKKDEATPSDPVTASGAVGQPATEATPELVAMLVKADAFDGTEDKVVSKCSSCGFDMDGLAEFSVKLHDYTLHFCSEKCQKNFETDTAAKVLAMTIPEK